MSINKTWELCMENAVLCSPTSFVTLFRFIFDLIGDFHNTCYVFCWKEKPVSLNDSTTASEGDSDLECNCVLPLSHLEKQPLPWLSMYLMVTFESHSFSKELQSTGFSQVLESIGIWKVSWKVLGFLIFIKNPRNVLEFYTTFDKFSFPSRS